jgi:hypothetical protein
MIAGGCRPAAIWVPDDDAARWADAERECREIAAAEDEAEANSFIEAASKDVLRLIDDEEATAGWRR